MSRCDFELMSLDELRETFRSWSETRDEQQRTVWEAARMEACIIIQPFVKGKLEPKKVLPLPWDRSYRSVQMTKEERQHRQERLSYYLKHGEWPD